MDSWPEIAVIWMHNGKDSQSRLGEISRLNYSDLEVLSVDASVGMKTIFELLSPTAKICVFWADDNKPVAPDFLKEMVRPLCVEGADRAVMHYWAGNALAIPKQVLDTSGVLEFATTAASMLKMLVSLLDGIHKVAGTRVQVAFSSTERLAPMTMEPVGFPS
jgi:hypothetical protein